MTQGPGAPKFDTDNDLFFGRFDTERPGRGQSFDTQRRSRNINDLFFGDLTQGPRRGRNFDTGRRAPKNLTLRPTNIDTSNDLFYRGPGAAENLTQRGPRGRP